MENGDIWETDSMRIESHPNKHQWTDFFPAKLLKLTLPLWVLMMLIPRGLCCMLLWRCSMEPWPAVIVMLLSWAVKSSSRTVVKSILLYNTSLGRFFSSEVLSIDPDSYVVISEGWRCYHIMFGNNLLITILRWAQAHNSNISRIQQNYPTELISDIN